MSEGSGRIDVPMRPIFEALGASVEWNADTQSVEAGIWPMGSQTGTEVDLTVGSTTAIVITAEDTRDYVGNLTGIKTDSENPVTLEYAPYIKDGHVMVPLRFTSDALGGTVNWSSDMDTALLNIN